MKNKNFKLNWISTETRWGTARIEDGKKNNTNRKNYILIMFQIDFERLSDTLKKLMNLFYKAVPRLVLWRKNVYVKAKAKILYENKGIELNATLVKRKKSTRGS